MAASLLLGVAPGCAAADEPPASSIPSSCLIGGQTPDSIADVVERINALPHPLSLPCFLASLPRPLSVVATNSTFSVQPAVGDENPRLFLLSENLVLSVVPDGEGSHLLELSEWTEPTRTIKAELPFPIEAPISHDAPYADLHYASGLTRCGLCHPNEIPVEGRPGAYVSDALRPLPSHYAPVAGLDDALASCDWQVEAERCQMLSALLDFGVIEEVTFSDELSTFFD